MGLNEMVELQRRCTRMLSGNYPQSWMPQEVLADLARMTAADLPPDNYGEGELIHPFEDEIAQVLGKETAVFMPSGTMAQQIALRIWTQRTGCKNVAFHPKCHLEIHERKGYQALHGLQGVLVGNPERLMTLDELKQLREPLGTLLIELPQREIGGQLPSWEDLTEMLAWAQDQKIPTHLDGARLWESAPFYNKSYAEIAGLFDSAYVSFYKGLGGISGAVLAGKADFIGEARVWMRRYGGNLKSLYPFVLAAKKGFDAYLPKMPAYYQKAVEIAAVLSRFSEIEIVPNPPQTNMMHLYLRGNREHLERAAREMAREEGVFLFYSLSPAQIPAYHKVEVTIKEAGLDWSAEEVQKYFEQLFKKAA